MKSRKLALLYNMKFRYWCCCKAQCDLQELVVQNTKGNSETVIRTQGQKSMIDIGLK